MENSNNKYLIEGIVNAIREKAKTTQSSSRGSGTIRIAIIPIESEANDYFGGLGNFDRRTNIGPACVDLPNDVVRYEVVYDLFPGQNHVSIFSRFSSNSQTIGLTVQKHIPQPIVDESIGKVSKIIDWAKFEICVSGVSNMKDAFTCASAATWVVQSYFRNIDLHTYTIKGPEY